MRGEFPAIEETGKVAMIQGAVFAALGGATILFPEAFGKGLELLLILLFAILAVSHIAQAIRSYPFKGWSSQAIGGGISLLICAILIAYPLTGIFTMAFLLMIFFFFDGVVKIAQGVALWEARGAGWILFSGCLSLFIAIAMLSGFPETAALLFSTFVGICLLLVGLSLLTIGWSLIRTTRN